METNTISLEKGNKLNLTKDAPGLKNAAIGLGWDVNEEPGKPAFDLDASVFMLNAQGKLSKEKNFVFFHNLSSPCGSVQHSGDNLTGVGDGDDETINVDLAKVPEDVNELHFIVNIYQAAQRNQNFGQVKKAFIRIYDKDTKAEILKYDLSEDQSSQTAMLMGRLYRHNTEWKFEATGTGEKAGLDTYLARYRA